MNEQRKNVIIKILKYYFITRIVLILLMILFNDILKINYPEVKNIMYIFDNTHYLNIAKNGYSTYIYSTFPLTSILIRYLGKIGYLLLNQILTILSAYLLYLIGEKYLKLEEPLYPTIFWLFSPISVLTLMFYSEGLFMFLTIAAYYLYKEKKYYFILGLLLGLAVMTRNLGSMLFFAIFICMFINLIKKKETIKKIIITFIPATIISLLYPTYLYVKTGSFFTFITVQGIYWRRIKTNIFRILYDATILLIHDHNLFFVINYFLTFSLIGFIIYIIIKKRKEKACYDIYLYVILTIIAICSSIRGYGDATASFYRYIFGCFSVYFILPRNKICATLLGNLTLFITVFFLLNYYFY